MQDEVGLDTLQGYNTQQMDRALRKVGYGEKTGQAHELDRSFDDWWTD